jgi:hypothetical protein
MTIVQRFCNLVLLAPLVAVTGCSDRIPETASRQSDSLTTVRYDPTTPLLNDVPWPNDSFCWGETNLDEPCQPNVATASLTPVYADWVSSINDTLGWSTTGSISLPIHRAVDAYAGPALDISRLLAAQRDTDFTNDALYVIDLSTGLPISLDFGSALTSFVLQSPIALDPSDPHRNAPSLLIETDDERYDPTSYTIQSSRTSDGTAAGSPVYRPEWDRDSDGLLDVPVYERGQRCAAGESNEASIVAAHARCVADNLVPYYDPEQERLRIRPRAPLREHTTYAVVITNRLLDNRQRPIGSPFTTVYHPIQKTAGARVETILSDTKLHDYYGSLAGTGLNEVRFLFTFTTAAPVTELRTLARSLTRNKGSERLDYIEAIDLDQTCGKSILRDVLVKHLSNSLALELGEREAITDALANVATLYTGEYTHPNYFTKSGGTLRIGRTPNTDLVTIPFLLTLPRNSDTSQPVPVAIVSHDVHTNRLEGLRSAGQWARLGLSAVLFDRLGAKSRLNAATLEALHVASNTACFKSLTNALLAERTDASWSVPSSVSFDVLSTRDLWRASSIELSGLTRALVETTKVTHRTINVPEWKVLGYLGQGEGAAIAGLAATLPDAPKTIVAVDPTSSPARAWARGTTWGTPPVERLKIFGPRVAGVPVNLLGSAQTRCNTSETSLRLLSPSENYSGGELGCLPLHDIKGSRFPNGATVLVTNLNSHHRRCVGMTNLGEFSLGIPADNGDRFELLVYEGQDIVQRFGRNEDCTVDANRFKPVFELTLADNNEVASDSVAGLGLERQSAEFRSAIDWAEAAFGLANPGAFFAELGRATPGPDAVGTLIVLSPGDPVVAPDEGLSIAIASGLIPHLPADSLMAHPEFAIETTPTLFSKSVHRPTAELALSLGHFAEGAPWLMRDDPEPLVCGVNRVDASTPSTVCQPTCETDADCPNETTCVNHTCQPATVSVELCAQSLYDADRLSDDLSGTNAQGAIYPLRIGRYAGMPTADNLAMLWQPRTSATTSLGVSAPLHPNWPFVALSLPLAMPRGSHGIPSDNVCQRFRFGTYVPHLVARFLLTRGRDFPPISNWFEQSCLSVPEAPSTCSFLDLP